MELPNSAGSLPKVNFDPVPLPGDSSRLDKSKQLPASYANFDDHHVLVPNPSQRVRSVLRDTVSGTNVYDVHYTIDSTARRLTPQSDLAKRTRHLLFLGCSLAFGEGVEDDETLPANLARLAPDYHVYNLGFHAYSPAALWLRSQYGDLMDHINESEGMAIYLFFDGHVHRVFGAMSVVATWGAGLPYLTFDQQGVPTFRGTFEKNRRWTTLFYNFFWRTQTRQFLDLDFPNLTQVSYFRKFGQLVSHMKNVYSERTGSKKFYVVFYPGTRFAEGLRPELDRLGIPYLDYSDLLIHTVTLKPTRIPIDTHPTPEAHRIMAELINRDLLQKEGSHEALVEN